MQLFPDTLTDFSGGSHRIAEEVDRGSHIQKCLVDAELLNIRSIFFQQMDQGIRALGIKFKTGWDQNKIRAFAKRLGDSFSGCDAIFFGWSGLGQNDTVTGFLVTANCGRNGAKIQCIWILGKAINGLPA